MLPSSACTSCGRCTPPDSSERFASSPRSIRCWSKRADSASRSSSSSSSTQNSRIVSSMPKRSASQRRIRLLSASDSSTSRSASQTPSAASSVQPPRKTERAVSSRCSSGVSSSYDHSIVARSVRCRASASRPPLRRSRRPPSRSSSCSVVRTDVRAAASSIASGRSSRRAQSSSTCSSGRKRGELASARVTNSARASGRARASTAYTCSPWTRSRSRLVTRTSRPRAGAEQQRQVGRSAHHVLEVVEQQQHPAVADRFRERPAAEHARRTREDCRRFGDRGERHPPDAVRILLGGRGGGLEGEARLAAAARAREAQQTDVGASEQFIDLAQLGVPTEERRQRHGQVRRVERLQRREVIVAELVDALRRRQVLQAVLAEIVQAVDGNEVVSRAREQHLPAVARCGDPRGAVDVDPDVALVGHDGLPRVEPHANADRTVVERRLPLGGRGKRVGRAGERDEERVALRVDLDAAVPRERVPQQTTVLAQQLDVAVSVLVQQPRRAFDVREQEGDRAGWKLAHNRIMR